MIFIPERCLFAPAIMAWASEAMACWASRTCKSSWKPSVLSTILILFRGPSPPRYEHSIKVPLIVHGPGVVSGQISSMPVYLHDVGPTILEFVGVHMNDQKNEHSYDGASFRHLLQQNKSLDSSRHRSRPYLFMVSRQLFTSFLRRTKF